MRGKTRPGRLAALDRLLCAREAPLLAAPGDAQVVDLGFGEHPHTTLELAAALRARGWDAPVLGVELDPVRVAGALPWLKGAPEGVALRQGGFAWWQGQEEARLVRAMNVLREYPPASCAAAHALLGERLIPGGLLVEGTCGPQGEVLVAHGMRKEGGQLVREQLIFMTDLSRGFAPILFRDRLPQDLRGAAQPGGALAPLFDAWRGAWEDTRRGAAHPREAFARSVAALQGRLDGVDPDPALAEAGTLIWRPGKSCARVPAEAP